MWCESLAWNWVLFFAVLLGAAVGVCLPAWDQLVELSELTKDQMPLDTVMIPGA